VKVKERLDDASRAVSQVTRSALDGDKEYFETDDMIVVIKIYLGKVVVGLPDHPRGAKSLPFYIL
jgi:hypothetical protein